MKQKERVKKREATKAARSDRREKLKGRRGKEEEARYTMRDPGSKRGEGSIKKQGRCSTKQQARSKRQKAKSKQKEASSKEKPEREKKQEQRSEKE